MDWGGDCVKIKIAKHKGETLPIGHPLFNQPIYARKFKIQISGAEVNIQVMHYFSQCSGEPTTQSEIHVDGKFPD